MRSKLAFRVAVTGVILLFAALRGFAWYEMGQSLYGRYVLLDSEYYYEVARGIAAGKWQQPTAYFFGPGWPLLLGAFYTIAGTATIAAGRLLNTGLSLVTLCGLGYCGWRTGGSALALIAMAAWTLFEPALFYEQTLLMESSASCMLTLVMVVWCAIGMNRPEEEKSAPALIARFPWLSSVLGLVLGICALFRANVAILAPLLAAAMVWIIWRSRRAGSSFIVRTVVAVLLFGVTLLIPVAPITWHNWRAEGVLIPISSNLGINLWAGVGPEATGRYVKPPSATDNLDQRGAVAAEQELGRKLNSSEVSAYWSRKAMEGMTWERVLHLTAVKLRLIFQRQETPQIYIIEEMDEDLAFLRWPVLSHVAIIVPLFAGIYALGRSRSPGRVAVAASAVATVVSLLPFFITDRYKLSIAPLTILVSGAGVHFLARRLYEKNWLDVVVGTALLGTGMFGLVWPVDIPDVAFYHARGKATLLLRDKQYTEALKLVRKANKERQDAALLATEATIIEATKGDMSEAAELYERAARLAPLSAKHWFNAGQAQLRAGMHDKARASYGRAVELDPNISSLAWHNLAVLRMQVGETSTSIAAFREALRLDSRNQDSRKLLEKLQR